MVPFVPYIHYVRAFQNANATSLENAKTLDELRFPASWTLRRLVLNGVIIQCDENRFYLDYAAYPDFVRAEDDRLYLVAQIILLLVVICLIWLLAKIIF